MFCRRIINDYILLVIIYLYALYIIVATIAYSCWMIKDRWLMLKSDENKKCMLYNAEVDCLVYRV